MIEWKMLHPKMTSEHLGFIPDFVFEHDPRSAKEQFNERYWPGWKPFNGFEMIDCDGNNTLVYPGDPPLPPMAEAWLRDEKIMFYEHSWVAIIQKDGSFEVCRMD